jgi:hypothetical protein
MSYYSEVMADSPGVFLRLDETVTGTASAGNTVALDSSGNDRHGVIHNAQQYPALVNPTINKIPEAKAVLGRPSLSDSGTSVELGENGQSGGYVVLPDVPLSNDYTIEFIWQPYTNAGYSPKISVGRPHYYMGPSGNLSQTYHQVEMTIGIGTSSGGNYIYLDTFSHAPELDASTTYRRSSSTILLNPNIQMGVKQHVVIVRSGLGRTDVITNPGESQIAVYINGALTPGMPFGTGGFTYPNPSGDQYDIGDYYSYDTPYIPTAPPSAYAGLPPLRFIGSAALLDEVAYYPHALSAARIQAHNNAKGTNLTGSTTNNLRAWTTTSSSLVVPTKIYMEGRDLTRMTVTSETNIHVPTVVQGTPDLSRLTTGYIANPGVITQEQTWDQYGNPIYTYAPTASDASVDGINIDARSKVTATFSLARFSMAGEMDIEAAEPQTKVLGKALERDSIAGVRWRRGTLVDACNDIEKDTPQNWSGQWYGQRYGDTHGGVTVVSGAIEATYQSWSSDYLFRRIGSIDTSVEGWIGVDWRVIRANPADVGKWCKIDFVGSSGHIYYIDQQKPRDVATDPNTGTPMTGWERSWFQVPAGGVSEPGFELRVAGLVDEDKVQIAQVVRAETPTEKRFHPKLVLRQPPQQLSNNDTDVYRNWPYARNDWSADGYSSYTWVYAGSVEHARKLTPIQSVSIKKAVDSSAARIINPSPARLIKLGRAVEPDLARGLYPPPQLKKATQVETAGRLRPVFAPILIGRATETDQVVALDKLDATITLVGPTPTLAAYAFVEQQAPVLTLIAEPSTIESVPATIRLTILGGLPTQLVTVAFEDQILAQGTTDSDGNLYQLPVIISGDVGVVGTQTLVVTQNGVGAVAAGEIAITIADDAAPTLPPVSVPDAPPTPVVQPPAVTVRKWVFQDPSPGGLGSYVLPVNPSQMTSPHHEHAMTSRHTTSRSGRFHIFQAAMLPKEWQFGGYCPTQEMVEKLWQFRDVNRRIYIIDHHGRAWKVAITHLEVTPRLRHWYNNEMSDWGSDWSMTVTVLDQDPVFVP